MQIIIQKSLVRSGARTGAQLVQWRRCVATTSSSQVQQLVACKSAHDNGGGGGGQKYQQNKSEFKQEEEEEEFKYQVRMEHPQVWQSIEAIKRLGHRLARLDPLARQPVPSLNELTWSSRLINQLKMNHNDQVVPTGGFVETREPAMAVGQLLDCVWNIYAGQECGLEWAHMSDETEIEWLQREWEILADIQLSRVDEINLAKLMLECETFDHFMGAKFPTTKRYGCEGAEPMLVVVDELLRLCHLGSEQTIDNLIIGMPHRGRLNLLTCLLGFEPMAIFAKTRGEPELDLARAWMAQGDVLSHLSTNCRFVYGLHHQHIGLSRDSPEPINVTLLPNPSHLEVAAPMAMGAARGRAHNIHHGYSSSPKLMVASTISDSVPAQDYTQYLSTILPLQIHGDASLAGQGIIQETLQMANLPKFTTGGSLHLVVNNQIGYTTEPQIGRSSRHCTDVFKLIEAPVIHVNGANISSCIRATRLALNYRQKFHKDVAINLICYRQHGHNELDEPAFTQPLMYSHIRKRQSIPRQYAESIEMDKQQLDGIVNSYKQRLNEALKKCDFYKPDNDNYRNFTLPTEFHRDHVLSWQTGVSELETLRSIGLDSVRLPSESTTESSVSSFRVHPNLQRSLIDERRKRFSPSDAQLHDIPVDWATAELLAFGSLLKQNHSVRLAGQDVARGTFSTRHAVLFDQDTQQAYIPLNEMAPPQVDEALSQPFARAKLEVANTILSEEAALAYEFAYSMETCELTLWEAQFGDFFNTAQSIIDTLISSSESKWLKQSALTLLLPHGMDGAGPEHSSAHIERFLQMSSSSSTGHSIDTEARVNWSICNPTTPAQYFHLLRRQVLRPYRKPLIVMAPKVLFRHPECVSKLGEFGDGHSFEPILDDPNVTEAAERAIINKVVLCSGKIYYTLAELKRQHKIHNVALVRLEELCPFPIGPLVQTLRQYSSSQTNTSFYYFQEEHRNQGAYNYVSTRLEVPLRQIAAATASQSSQTHQVLNYLGRRESELPATGSSSLHKRELEQLLKQFVALKQ